MKSLIILLAILVVSAAYAKTHKPKANYYEQTGHMVYHEAKIVDLIEGRSDLYYSGDYICTPGDEHYAPDCRTFTDWHATEVDSYVEITLADGSNFVAIFRPQAICIPKIGVNPCQKPEPWKHNAKVLSFFSLSGYDAVHTPDYPLWRLATDWELSKPFPLKGFEALPSCGGDGSEVTFRYHVGNHGIEIYPYLFISR